MTATANAEAHEDNGQHLFRHEKRPQWGFAMLAWERGTRRAYQFDDGKMRIFKEGFYHLLQPVDVDDAVGSQVAAELEETLAARDGERRKPLKPQYSFKDQLRIFRELYPKGFNGEKWRKERRGEGSGKLKRHRDAAIEMAQDRLAAGEVQPLVEAGRSGEVIDRAVEVLKQTNLTSLGRVRQLDALEGEERQRAGEALVELLYGEERYGKRFRAWVRALKKGLEKKPSWRLVTALPALVHPDQHVCVRPSALRKQAAVFAPSRLYTQRPKRTAYKNYRRVADAARQRLEDEGLSPRDNLDVYDFVWATLRPAAAKHLE